MTSLVPQILALVLMHHNPNSGPKLAIHNHKHIALEIFIELGQKYLKGYSSDQSHFSEINVKLAEKNKYATHSVQRSLEMSENK